MRLGVVGCGAIGSAVALHCSEKLALKIDIKEIFDIDGKKSTALKKRLSGAPHVAGSIKELVGRCDLVLEAASVGASPSVVEECIAAGKDVIVLSVGGLVDKPDLLARVQDAGCRLYIPSGAVVGLDGIKAASVGRLEEVMLTTRKPIKGLKGAPYLDEAGIEIDSITEETVIFEGSAAEAIKAFPKNVNVSASLSLAGLGAEKTKVKVITSPDYKRNIHEARVKGEFGSFTVKMENLPSPENPKTSYLTVLSAIATIKGIVDRVRIGT